LLAFAGVAAAMAWGADWWRASTALLPSPRLLGVALPWGLAIAACLGLSWAMGQLGRRGAHER
ncbi:MAG: hypothetical protein HOQ02_06465, partial [Lysobacter sp.]|nr:hypothetical protein [Lysobacter sp.]